VRNWHGFGLGKLRSNQESAGGQDTRTRMLRFLQAQGIDTSRLSEGKLDRFMNSGRTVYLTVGRRQIRAPAFFSQVTDGSDANKLPPADVPEHMLFAMIQKQRQGWVGFMEAAQGDVVDDVLGRALRVALRSPTFAFEGWAKQSASAPAAGAGAGGGSSSKSKMLGRFVAASAELTVDMQTGEVLWRNDELKPVPDSMTQYADFETIFGKQALHCGLVQRCEHRLWVHIIGRPLSLSLSISISLSFYLHLSISLSLCLP
jgi:hypothetical protein